METESPGPDQTRYRIPLPSEELCGGKFLRCGWKKPGISLCTLPFFRRCLLSIRKAARECASPREKLVPHVSPLSIATLKRKSLPTPPREKTKRASVLHCPFFGKSGDKKRQNKASALHYIEQTPFNIAHIMLYDRKIGTAASFVDPGSPTSRNLALGMEIQTKVST